jgi:HPt (histidine-containing phosphotransfer) domain-containing protein
VLNLPPAAQAKFALLQQSFVAGLVARQQEIRGTQDAARVMAAAHRLAGAAGSYGFDALCGCARDVENRCAAGAHPDLASALDRLHQEIDRLTAQ